MAEKLTQLELQKIFQLDAMELIHAHNRGWAFSVFVDLFLVF